MQRVSIAGAKRRCPWCLGSESYLRYHDREWGVPVRDDRRLFEFLILEGAQAGLSWQTILNKRKNYRKAFAGFDPEKVARLGARDVRHFIQSQVENIIADALLGGKKYKTLSLTLSGEKIKVKTT